jgi:hypothetical protein
MQANPTVIVLKKTAKVYLKIADINIGVPGFLRRQILSRSKLFVLFYRNTHTFDQYFY